MKTQPSRAPSGGPRRAQDLSLAWVRSRLANGMVIPAHPLALTQSRVWDERRQRALTRYYVAAGAGGVAVGVHTTQFEIHDPRVGLYRPVLELAAEELNAAASAGRPLVRVAGLCGATRQAVGEATLARALGYHAGLLSLGALKKASETQLVEHCRAVADVLPLFGFYLQPAAGGRLLPYSFWRRFVAIENVVGIKIAPFNRYQTLEVLRALAESERQDIALYTGNDDNIVMDLLTPFRFRRGRKVTELRIVGGLLGHWAVWTRRAVELHRSCREVARNGGSVPLELLRQAAEVTDMNAALFDAANGYAGCIPGIHEILRGQGLLASIASLNPAARLSPGQERELKRVRQAYPHLCDDDFVERHREKWLKA